MQVIYKCNECSSEDVDRFKTEFDDGFKIIQGNEYRYSDCTVTFICRNCGAMGEDVFCRLNETK